MTQTVSAATPNGYMHLTPRPGLALDNNRHAEPQGPGFANPFDFSRESINPDLNVNFYDFKDWQWIKLERTMFKC